MKHINSYSSYDHTEVRLFSRKNLFTLIIIDIHEASVAWLNPSFSGGPSVALKSLDLTHTLPI